MLCKRELCLFCTIVFSLLSCNFAYGENFLLNHSFEISSGSNSHPDKWNIGGGGKFEYASDHAHSGNKSIKLSGRKYHYVHNKTKCSEGVNYAFKVWAKAEDFYAGGMIKLEFRDNSSKRIKDYKREFAAPSKWTLYEIEGIAPKEAVSITVTMIGGISGKIIYDDVSLEEVKLPSKKLYYDISKTSHEFLGFGAQVWAYGNSSDWRNLEKIRRDTLKELNIKYVRIENLYESASWDEMKKCREMTDSLGIEWLYTIWSAPKEFVASGNKLKNPEGFGNWWVNKHISDLYAHGIKVEYIELMNEPDSGGHWSTGISYDQYNVLVNSVYKHLKSNGFKETRIVGPGTSSMNWSRPYAYISKIKRPQVMGAWSTHAWTDDTLQSEFKGGLAIEDNWNNYFGPFTKASNPSIPLFVTELASKQNLLQDVKYPEPDKFGKYDNTKTFPYYNLTNSVPFGVRTFENLVAVLNSGSGSAFLWQLNDEPTEVFNKKKGWGLVDLWGKPKPCYEILKTFMPNLPVGSKVVISPDQRNNQCYSGMFVNGDKVILAVANNHLEPVEFDAVISTGINQRLRMLKAVECTLDIQGDPSACKPDTVRVNSVKPLFSESSELCYSFNYQLKANSTIVVEFSLN